jgi:hypothetical protein
LRWSSRTRRTANTSSDCSRGCWRRPSGRGGEGGLARDRFICVDIERLDALLHALREARELFNRSRYVVNFCVDCMAAFDWPGDYRRHEGHTVTFTDVDHDGIGEWIAVLEWLKRRGVAR